MPRTPLPTAHLHAVTPSSRPSTATTQLSSSPDLASLSHQVNFIQNTVTSMLAHHQPLQGALQHSQQTPVYAELPFRIWCNPPHHSIGMRTSLLHSHHPSITSWTWLMMAFGPLTSIAQIVWPLTGVGTVWASLCYNSTALAL